MEVVMPQLGETVAEGKILTWFKKIGDAVKEGDNIFEVETDKVTVEVQAIASGKLTEIRVDAGTVAKVGTVVAVIGDSTPQGRTAAAAPAKGSAAIEPFNEVRTAQGQFLSVRQMNGVRITPLARRLIVQNGLDVGSLARSALARGEKVIRSGHVREALEASQSATLRPVTEPGPRPLAVGTEDAIPLNPIRQRTAQRLAESWRTVPHVFQAIDIDFNAVDEVRRRFKDRYQARIGAALTYLPFICRAVCLAIRDFPRINTRFEGDRLIVSRDINLGIAVDLSHNGLVVPVVRRASELSFEELVRAIAAQVGKARAGVLAPDDVSGGTYTISNNGSFGTLFTAPIINLPQAAILSTDAVRKRPVVIETSQGDFIAAHPVGMVTQSFDHRAFDGAYSAAFLSRLKEIVEGRDWSSDLI